MLSNDGVTYQTVAINPSATNFSATVPWALSAGNGLKTVYVKYVDTPTPNNIYGPFTAEITLDTEAPVTTASPVSGTYNGAINVVLASEPSATIYYTTAVGPLTIANGQVYSGPISISTTATLQFMAIDQAQNQEAVQSRTYTITPQGTSIELSLGSGWNLIASPEPIVVDSFALAHPEIISLWKYEFGTWSVYLNNGTTIAYANSKGFGILDTINQGEGFWVNVQVPLTLTFQSIDVIESISLVEGWSLRGLKGKAALSIPEMQTLAGAQSFTVTSVWKWSNNGWFVTLPGKTDLGQDYANSKGFTLLTVVNPGEGFWVNALALPAN
jgi:hypothetical protein